uniref:Resolvase HTH domain-containing protein n=1 Tax=uncultured prokaryote TaxID=198431 RepID=A0A0H5PYK1_9ZZZZ|nr:hypothetical protein [uncultured prokaryote]
MNYNALSYDRSESSVQPMLFSANEPALYQDDTKTGYFSVLIKSGTGSGMKIQTSHPLEHLQFVLSALDPNRDTWISQASFFKKNRRVVNLKSVGLSFLDIDCYRLSWAKGLPPEVMAKHFVAFCEHEGVPAPSLIVFSGRGLQPKWLFEEALPQAALPRWNAVQKTLLGKLERYGADPMARDASRVLRLVETINTKSGAYCHVVHQTSGLDGLPIRYDFDAFADLILPFTREEIRQRRAELAEKALERVQRALERPECILTTDSLNWGRLLDLRQLVAMRGGIHEGMRMMMLAYQMNFLALSRQVEPSTFFLEAKQVANAIDPTWGFHNTDLSAIIGKFKEALAGKTVFFAGREYSPLYTPTNETLIDLFQITDDEQRQLKTIISSTIKLERKLETQKTKRRQEGMMARADYEGRADARYERAMELRSQGLSIRKIALEMGISKSRVQQYLSQKN